jgi:hypothetical protein
MNQINVQIEEAQVGDVFVRDNKYYILARFMDGHSLGYNYMCVSLRDGHYWLPPKKTIKEATESLILFRANAKITIE